MRTFIRSLFYRLSPTMRSLVRRVVFAPVDLIEAWTGRRHPLVPPRGMIYTGSGDFLAQGRRFREYFTRYAGLHPGSRILDVGSGIGRMAVPLTEVLDPEKGGLYEGFDVIRTGVDWCQNHITAAHPRFQFRYVPLHNDLYRSDGDRATEFRFPYPDAHFDLVILTSVFTHMLPDELVHYLGEIHRVLVPGSKVFATFFIWNQTAERLSAGSDFGFPYDRGHYRLMDERVRSANVAYDELWLMERFAALGFSAETILYGSWCGRTPDEAIDFQDMVVLSREDHPGISHDF